VYPSRIEIWQIESLIDDVDYRSRLSRTDLESALSDAVSLFSSPIPSALSAAGISLDDITSLILFGGNTRVPFVQAAIRDALGGRDIIAQNVNADEGAVLGAAYYGAALSRQFKMKSIEVSETSVWEFTLGTDEVIFPKGTRMGTKKALVLPAEDQTIEFYQAG
jgi:hypoxia up-regulated 1